MPPPGENRKLAGTTLSKFTVGPAQNAYIATDGTNLQLVDPVAGTVNLSSISSLAVGEKTKVAAAAVTLGNSDNSVPVYVGVQTFVYLPVAPRAAQQHLIWDSDKLVAAGNLIIIHGNGRPIIGAGTIGTAASVSITSAGGLFLLEYNLQANAWMVLSPNSTAYTVVSFTSYIWSADFSAHAFGGFALTGFAGGVLTLTRTTTASVQTGVGSLDSSMAVNNARVGSIGAPWRGLLVEESRTNYVWPATTNASNWFPGSATAVGSINLFGTYLPDANGTTYQSVRYTVTAGQYSHYVTTATLAIGSYVGSSWQRGNGGPVTAHPVIYPASAGLGSGGDVVATIPGGNAWTRLVTSPANFTSTSALWFVPADGRTPNTAFTGDSATPALGDFAVDCHQVENGLFATEWIPTTSAPVTRAGEHLSVVNGVGAVDQGQLSIYAVCYPKGSSTQYGADAYFFYIDASNYCVWNHTTQIVTIACNGTTVASSYPCNWNAIDTLEVFVQAGGGRNATFSYRINNIATRTILNAPLAGNYAPVSTIDLFCNGVTNQLTAWFQKIFAYRSTQSPAGFGNQILLTQSFATGTPGNIGILSSYGNCVLTLTRGCAATVQTSATTIDTTPIGHQARLGNNGVVQGLVFEEARTNLLATARGITSGWGGSTATSVTANYSAGPDGTAAVTVKYVMAAGQVSHYYNGTLTLTANIPYTASTWQRADTGTITEHFVLYDSLHASGAEATGTGTTAWTRLVVTMTTPNAGQGYFIPADARAPLFTGESSTQALGPIVTDCQQVEQGAFPTEWIATPGGPTARQQDQLQLLSTVVSNGQVSIDIVLFPKGGATQYSADMYLWANSANDCVSINHTTRMITAFIAGVSVTGTVAASWNAQDKVEFFFRVGGGVNAICQYRVNNGPAITLLNAPLAGNYGTYAGGVLSYQGSNVFSCWLQSFTGYVSGYVPGWVTLVPAQMPFITAITPNVGSAAGGTTKVVIIGGAFTGLTSVKLNGTEHISNATVSPNGTQITISTTLAGTAAANSAVQVTTPGGTLSWTGAGASGWTYLPANYHHLRPDLGVTYVAGAGGTMSGWLDQGDLTAVNATQVTATAQPSCTADSGYASYPLGVYFTNTSYVQCLQLGSLASMTNGHMFQVKRVGSGAANIAGDLLGTGATEWYAYNDGNIYLDFGTNTRKTFTKASFDVTALHCLEVRSASAAWSAYYNGSSMYTTATNTVAFPATPYLGQNGFGGLTAGFQGFIYEFLVWNRILTAAEILIVKAYLANRHSITIA